LAFDDYSGGLQIAEFAAAWAKARASFCRHRRAVRLTSTREWSTGVGGAPQAMTTHKIPRAHNYKPAPHAWVRRSSSAENSLPETVDRAVPYAGRAN
jgi:hypothetical protein